MKGDNLMEKNTLEQATKNAVRELIWLHLEQDILYDNCEKFSKKSAIGLTFQFFDISPLDIALDILGVPQDNTDMFDDASSSIEVPAGLFCRDSFYDEFATIVLRAAEPDDAITAYIHEVTNAVKRYADEFGVERPWA